MKAIFFTVLLASLSGFAANPEFEIVESKLAPSHQLTGEGSIKLDYQNQTARLYVDRNVCPPGMYCTMEMRPPMIITLPIVSVEVGNCNIKTVIAREDQRPVDGMLKQLTVVDFSENTCPTFAKIIGDAEYLTTVYNSYQGMEVTEVSTMKTKLVRHEAAVLLEKNVNVAFAPESYRGTYSLQILADGSVRRVDNHGQIEELPSLLDHHLVRIQKLIRNLGSVKLIKGSGPECMDAPFENIVAHKNSKNVELWQRMNCQETKTNNSNAQSLIRFINKIEEANPDHN